MRPMLMSAVCVCIAGCAQGGPGSGGGSAPAPSDSSFAALQARGASAAGMGVDQYTSVHRFDDLPDGGRIELQRGVEDAAGVEQIRSHLRHITSAFSQGDFQIPGFVHDRAEVPGTRIMAAKRSAIRYEYRDLPRGGEVRIRSTDAEAVEAIHQFLAFQREDHHAAGHAHH